LTAILQGFTIGGAGGMAPPEAHAIALTLRRDAGWSGRGAECAQALTWPPGLRKAAGAWRVKVPLIAASQLRADAAPLLGQRMPAVVPPKYGRHPRPSALRAPLKL
jgi:hypothetical protein